MYKLYFGGMKQPFVILISTNTFISLKSSDPANNDYQQFKVNVEAGAKLQDAEGNPMSQEAAIEFVRGLP